MAQQQSPHLTDIPQAIQIAAATDPSIDPSLKQQALDYLQKVKERCDETWQDCLSLYLQGAGAASAGAIGSDGKEKLDPSMRMFCEQIVDATMIRKPEAMSAQSQKAMYDAIVDFVRTEYVEGSCEGGQSFLRNKLSFTIAHLFLNAYPNTILTFLHPFVDLLVPSNSSKSLSPSLLAVHLLIEIALEIHDTVMRSARPHSGSRQQRDGVIRDVIRTSGDEQLVVKSLLTLTSKGLEMCGSGNKQWLEVTQLGLKALGAWTPWVDLAVALTPETLGFYHQVLQQDITSLRNLAASILRTFTAKGMRDPSEKLQVLKVLNILSVLDPLESQTRSKEDHEMVLFRASLAGVLQVYGTELIKLTELDNAPEQVRNEADAMLSASIPLILRFLSDRHPEVPTAVSPFVSDLLRTFKKYVKPPAAASNGRTMAPPPPPVPLPPGKREFLLSVLEVVVRQLEWPEDVEWEAVQDQADADEAVEAFCAMRKSFRSVIDHIASIDKTLHAEVVASIVINTLERLANQGPSAVTWQQAELAAFLIFTFGEIAKTNSRAAFYELPPELLSKTTVKMVGSSGQSTPTGGAAPDIAILDSSTKIDYEQYPLTPLGRLLTLSMSSGLASYPHPSVPLMYFEIAVRYVDFWKVKQGAIQPMFEALLDTRGIRNDDEGVRRRSFYLLARFIKECKIEMDKAMIPIILDSLREMLEIHPKLPQADTPDDDPLLKATTGKNYFQDQLHLFEASGMLVYLTKSDPQSQMSFLAAIAGPLMAGVGAGLEQYKRRPQDQMAVLHVHHHLMALGHFAKGFPSVSDDQLEAQPYRQPFKQMTEALLEALEVMKTQRVVRDSGRFAFSQFVNAIGSSVAELVPRFVNSVVTEFEPAELVDFLTFLSLLMHRLKRNTFETMDMLLLPLLSSIFAILKKEITGTDEAVTHRRLQEAYLAFFTALMNANLEGVFISGRNKPEFENVIQSLMDMSTDSSDMMSQRLAFAFFSKSVIAWATSADAVSKPSVFSDSAMSMQSLKVAAGLAAPTNQHAISKEERAAMALPGYENFIYQRLVPTVFTVSADPAFNVKQGLPVLYEMAGVLRNVATARGQEGIDFLIGDMLPKIGCPASMAQQFIERLRTQPAKDFRKTYAEFIKAMRS
ncbi:hypothetical protein CspHIS471_0511660 [Cutaneotrichosporon sp. HIS471]|nr:hypothetical protein CspHIS471_0511660 [Cutaneotrichosporon sp. HIS471]